MCSTSKPGRQPAWRQRLRAWESVLPVTALLVFSMLARMARSQDQPEPILHEFFLPGPDEAISAPIPLPRLEEQAFGQLIYGARGPVLVDESVLDQPGGLGLSIGGVHVQVLDRQTEEEGWLDYHVAFDPAVVPFKRVGVLDQVRVERGEIQLVTRESPLRPVPLTDPPEWEETEQFWGAILVHLEPDVYVPIPSVAADMAIHRYITAPSVDLGFYRDEADNYLVRSSDHEGVIRLYYHVSAPRGYFSGPLPSDSLIEDIPRDLRPTVPQEVVAVSREVAQRMGLDQASPIARWVEGLSGYCRAFVAEPFPQAEQTENLFADILLGQRGTCRHRAFAFVVTAQAWGIPARYVYNEAHAFAEVFFPNRGWRRIDLGGAAAGLRIHDPGSRVLHVPVGGDPLPVPPGYLGNYSRRIEPPAQPASGTTGQNGSGGPPAGQGGASMGQDQPWDLFESAFESGQPSLAEEGEEPSEGASGVEPTREGRRSTALVLDDAPRQGFRGETVYLSGHLYDEQERGLPGRPVAVLLGPASGQQSDRTILMGWLESDGQGTIVGTVTIPASIPLGVWGIYLVFEGDSEYAPSRSGD